MYEFSVVLVDNERSSTNILLLLRLERANVVSNNRMPLLAIEETKH